MRRVASSIVYPDVGDAHLKTTAQKREKDWKCQKRFAVKLSLALGERSTSWSPGIREAAGKVASVRELLRARHVKSEVGLVTALSVYAVRLYLSKEDCGRGAKLQASLDFTRPEVARQGSLRLPRFKGAMKGW